MKLTATLLVLMIVLLGSSGHPRVAEAQTPVVPRRDNGAPRRPNDNLEGTIWQYRATRKDKDKKEVVIEGRLRIEENGVFEVDMPVELPGKRLLGLRKDDKAAKKSDDGASEEPKRKVTVPTTRGRRVGDVSKLDDGRTKLVIEAKDFPLQGILILWPKKDRPGVWMGTYQERKNDKNGEKWAIELREGED